MFNIKYEGIYFLSLAIYMFDFATLLPFDLSAAGSVSVGKIALLICACLYVSKILQDKIFKSSKKSIYLLSPLIFWFLYTTFSYLWSEDGSSAARYVVLLSFNFFALLLSIKVSQKNALKLISLTIIVSIFFAALDYLFGFRISVSRQYSFTNEIVGIYPNSISLGFTLGCIVSGLISYCIKINFKNIFIVTATILMLIVILLSGSRSALISATVSSIILLFVNKSQNPIRTIFYISVYFGLIAIIGSEVYTAILPQAISDKVSTIPALLTDPSEFSATARGQAINFGTTYFYSSPFIGNGAGAVETIFQNIPELAAQSNINAHNWWLEMAVNGGLISVLSFITAYFFLMKDSIKNLNSNHHILDYIYLGYLTAFPMLVFGPGSIMNLPIVWIMYGLVIGRIITYHQYQVRLENR